jgi:hypothetical protein
VKLSAGLRLKSKVCGMEAIVMHVPSAAGQLTCGGEALVPVADPTRATLQLEDGEQGQALIGKRYVDTATGLEVLCTKTGKGALSFDGRLLTLREAKPLPSSD